MSTVTPLPYSPVTFPCSNTLNSSASESGVERIQLDIGYNIWTKRVGNGPIKVLRTFQLPL